MMTVTASQMKHIDELTAEKYGIRSIILMENAGSRVAQTAANILKKHSGQIAVFCGSGNNGGDGLVAARHLFNIGYPVTVILAKSPMAFKNDAMENYKIAHKIGIRIIKYSNNICLSKYNLIIDALLGTGAKGEINGLYQGIIEKINLSNKPVIAVDIPSGLDADTGKPLGIAIKAKVTVTLGIVKKGLTTKLSKQFTGDLEVADISLPKKLTAKYS